MKNPEGIFPSGFFIFIRETPDYCNAPLHLL